MRDDQYTRLQALQEKLTDQLLTEADPANWSGDGIKPSAMTQEERGNRYWCKKNAVATVSLLVRVGTVIGMVQRAGGTLPPSAEGDTRDGLLDEEIAQAERDAKRLMSKFETRARAKVPSQDAP